MGKILRRTFLIGSAAVAGGVAFGYYQLQKPYPNPLSDGLKDGAAALTPYVLIDQAGVTIIAPRAEMGQGVRTTLAALVAEELDVALEDVSVIHGPAAKAYYNAAGFEEAAPFPVTDEGLVAETVREMTHVITKIMGQQSTGGSTTIPDGFEKMRKAGAAARIALVKAAAKKLNMPAARLRTVNGAVAAPDGAVIPYTELAVLARDIEPPRDPALKPQSEWRLLGKSQPKVDMREKCTGAAEYAVDVRLPGMVFATVRANPHLGAGARSFDAAEAEKMPGVQKIVPVDNGFAAIATNSWAAMRAVDAIAADWEPANYPATTAAVRQQLIDAFGDEPESQKRDDGDVEAALNQDDIVQAEYFAPYLAHATMEPMSAAALLKDGRLDVWIGTQAPTRCLDEAAAMTGLAEENINIHTTYLGGGFGRRGEVDYLRHAIQLAEAMEGTPVSMIWSREEDMRHDVYRPMAVARFRGAVADGEARAFDLHLSASPCAIDGFARRGMDLNMADPTTIQNAWDNPYTIENYRVSGYRAPVALPLGFWRSVGASQNGFFQECAMDELAHAAGADPVAFRLRSLGHGPSRKVIEKVAEMSGWNGGAPAGRARGIAYYLSFGVPVAEIVEVEMADGRVRITNIWAAADVGIALDPDNVRAQVQSGIIYGLSAAISGEITIEDGKVVQSNFHDYDVMRMYQAPPIEVAVLEHGAKIRGIGEPGLPPAAPALANAIFAATGKRIRSLPLNKSIDFI